MKNTYLFDGKQLKIIDEELRLYFEEKFIPLALPTKKEHGVTHKENHVLECFSDGPIPFAYGWIKEKKLDGEYQLVYPDQKIKSKQYYKEGNLHGPSLYFDKHGNLLSESWYINGLQQGKCTWYYPNKNICSKQLFLDGVWHGMQLFYYPNKIIKSELSYKKGRLDGTTRLFHPDGEIERFFIYENGSLIQAQIAPPHSA